MAPKTPKARRASSSASASDVSGQEGPSTNDDPVQPNSPIQAADEQMATQSSSNLQAVDDDERVVKLLTMIQSNVPSHIISSSDPKVSEAWESVVNGVGANLLENSFGTVSAELMVTGVRSWVQTLDPSSPEELSPIIPTSSSQSLLQSRKPKCLSREEVKFLFAETNFGTTQNWGPALQILMEEGVHRILSPTGLTVSEVSFLTFSGYMQSKNKNIFQRQFTSCPSSIPDWGAGRRRTESKFGSSSSSSSSLTRRLAQLSSMYDNPGHRRALTDIPESLHKSLYYLAKSQAQGVVDGKLQLELSALVELEIWCEAQEAIYVFCGYVCDLFAEHRHNWATLLLEEELAPNGDVSTTIDMRVPPTVIELTALIRGLSTSKGVRALETLREAFQNDSMDAGIDHLARLYSTTYKPEHGIFSHFQRFREMTALARAHAEGPGSRPHPGTSDWCGLMAAVARVGQAFRLMPAEFRVEVKSLVDAFHSGRLSSWEDVLDAASTLEKKGLCTPTKNARPSHTDTVDSALGAQGRSSGPSHQPFSSPPSKSSYLEAARQLSNYLSRVKLSHFLESVPVLGGTCRLVRDPSTGRVPEVPKEKYFHFPQELKTHFWLLRNALNPKHSSYFRVIAESPAGVAPASSSSISSGPPRSGKGPPQKGPRPQPHRPQPQQPPKSPQQPQRSKGPPKSRQMRTAAGASGSAGQGSALQTELAALRKDIASFRSSSLSEQQPPPQHLPVGPPRPPHLPPQQWWPPQQPVFYAQQPFLYGYNAGQGDGSHGPSAGTPLQLTSGPGGGGSIGGENSARDSDWRGPSGGGLSGGENPARDSDWQGPSGGGF